MIQMRPGVLSAAKQKRATDSGKCADTPSTVLRVLDVAVVPRVQVPGEVCLAAQRRPAQGVQEAPEGGEGARS